MNLYIHASLKPAKLLVTKSTNLQALPPAATIILVTRQPHVLDMLTPTSRTRRVRSCISGSWPPRTSASSPSLKVDHLQPATSVNGKSALKHMADHTGSKGSGPHPESSNLTAAFRMADASLQETLRYSRGRCEHGPETGRIPNRSKAKSKSSACRREEWRGAAALQCSRCKQHSAA